MEIRRKALAKLWQWKQESNGTSALLIEGARRVGKSYLIRQFAQEAYKSYLMVDFSDASKTEIEIFENFSSNRNEFFSRLAALKGVELYPRESCIIFDEVQRYPKARQLVKHLVADGRYDILETGSLISLKANVKDIVIPSEEEKLELCPLDLEEFAEAMGKKTLFEAAREAFAEDRPMGPLHREMMNLTRLYMVVGGMPQVVSEYADDGNLLAVQRRQQQILALYRDDMTAFAARDAAKVRALFDAVPAQLMKPEKTFRLSSLSKTIRWRDYEEAFRWLEDSKTVNLCFNAMDPIVGLRMNGERSGLRCYMADTGLLLRLVTGSDEALDRQVMTDVLYEQLSLHEGMFLENLVAQMLRATGHPLRCFSQPRRAGALAVKLDFLIRCGDRICPVVVQPSGYAAHAALDRFAEQWRDQLGRRYVVSEKDWRREGDLVFLPVYMTAFL